MALRSVEDEWTRFSAMIFKGIKPDEVQVSEMKKAFFAGAWMMIRATEEIGEPHVSESQAMKYLDERKAELQEFSRRLMKEYADKN